MIKGMEELNVDHEALLDVYIRAYNNCIKNVPADMTVGLHLCRGNFKDGMHFSEGGYDRIAIKLFNQVNVNAFYVRRVIISSNRFHSDILLSSSMTPSVPVLLNLSSSSPRTRLLSLALSRPKSRK